MMVKTAYFLKHLFISTSLLGLTINATSCQVKPKPESTNNPTKTTSIYTKKAPHPDGTGKVYMGRKIAHVMSASGAQWLERDTRQEEENVALAISKLNLTPNSVVADIGAGTGYYTFRIARQIPIGKVYAVEVENEFISSLEKRKKELGLNNVEVIKGSNESPNLPAGSLDLVIMVDVYHELEYPHEMLKAIHSALKPNGKLLLLEYRAEDPAVPIKELHKMSIKQVSKELAANNFKLFKKEDFLPIQHYLMFEK